MHSGGTARVRHAVTAAVLIGAVGSAAACGTWPAPKDPEDAATLGALVATWDAALAGAAPASATELADRLRDAEPLTARSNPSVRYVPYRAAGQDVPEDAPLAIAVWEQRTGPDPFTDDVPRWERFCAVVHVDLRRAGLAAEQERCPREVPEEPPVGLTGQAPSVIDAEAPTTGALVVGERAPGGQPAGAVEPAVPAHAEYPCDPEGLAATVDLLSSTIGPTDSLVLRVVNTGTRPCTVPDPSGLTLEQDGEVRPVDARADGGDEVALAPRESAVAVVRWRPSQQVDRETPQHLTLRLGALSVVVRPGAGLPQAPVDADPGGRLDLGPWVVLGYGARLDDTAAPVDIAPACDPSDLAMATVPPRDASGSGTPPPPAVSATNIGVVACRLEPGISPHVLLADVALVRAPPTVLAPGWQVTAETTVPVPDRPGERFVAGEWVAVRSRS